jgi:hypothetical protein
VLVAAKDVDLSWFVADLGDGTVKMRYASDFPRVLNALREALAAIPAPLDVLDAAREVVRFYGTDRTWSLAYRAMLGSRIDDLDAALAATPAPLAPHPGEHHDYAMTCRRCGEPGYLFVGFHSPGETFRWSEAQPKEPALDGEPR